MYRSNVKQRQNSSEQSKTVQPRPQGWSIRKSSTHRISPFTKQEVSQLLKGDASKASISKLKVKRDSYNPARTKSSKIIGAVKAALVQDSRNFNVQLKSLEPTIKSLSPRFRHKAQEQSNADQQHHHFRKHKGRPIPGQESPLFSEPDLVNITTNPLSTVGEKLITIGGYIVSLQPAPPNITSMVRPRIVSDKDGFELEIKVLGCPAADIKFEKRYDTLIVIGIANSPIKRPVEERTKSTPLGFTHLFDGKGKLKDEREIKSAFFSSKAQDQQQNLSPPDHSDEIKEIINIFVPKNISLNQIFISKPDAKGRIFVKGP